MAAGLSFSADRLDFGAPLVGTIVTRKVELKNQDFGPLTVSHLRIETLSEHTEFSSSDEGAVAWTIKPGDSRTVTIKLAPKDEVVDNDRFCVDSNDRTNEHACIALTSHVEGVARLCGCVVAAGSLGPATPCDLSSQRLLFPPTALGRTVSEVVRFEDCGVGNQPLTIGDHNDLYFAGITQGLKVRALADAALTQQQSFPVVLQPPGSDEAHNAVPGKDPDGKFRD